MQSIVNDRKAPKRGISRAIRLGLVALVGVAGAVFGASACLDRPLCDTDCTPRTTNVFVDTVNQTAVNKIDLLFMIDNSSSMADKQAVLTAAVPQLVQRLVNPNCLNADGSIGAGAASPDQNCPGAETREFNPIRDIHVGIVTSSLGGHGATQCLGDPTQPSTVEEGNDKGELVGSRPRYKNPAGGEVVNQAQGFLAWEPGTGQAGAEIGPFTTTFTTMVTATDDQGCGYESQLEGWYRFLVDPTPYQSISLQPCGGGKCATPTGVDQTVITQRAAFLRPDSLVAIIMLTDENDCSIIEQGQYYLVAMPTSAGTIPPGTPECDQNPNDPCCRNCGTPAPPSGCQDQSQACQAKEQGWAAQDSANLRCWEDKKRYGIDFLYPTQRYVNALSQPLICPANLDLSTTNCTDGQGHPIQPVNNPLFASSGAPRDPSLVFFAGIVGVPWEDIDTQVDAKGKPYTDNGLHYQTAAQMTSNGTWDKILGNQSPGGTTAPTQPTDILMQESSAVRSGTDANGNPIVPPAGAPGPGQPGSNPINGHEWNADQNADLQYACIFPLAKARDCAAEAKAGSPHACDCLDVKASDANPLCQGMGEDPANPTDPNAYGTNQIYAKGYPGLREIQVLHDFGANSIVASICAKNLTGNVTDQDYGYNPAVDSIVERLKEQLSGKCLPLTLTPVVGADGKPTIPCTLIEARPRADVQQCDASKGRVPADPAVIGPVEDQLKNQKVCGDPPLNSCDAFLFCALQPSADPGCHTGAEDPNAVPGWCYVDPSQNANDSESLVANCPANEQRIINFDDPQHQTPASDATLLIACFGNQANGTTATVVTGAGGSATQSTSDAGP